MWYRQSSFAVFTVNSVFIVFTVVSAGIGGTDPNCVCLGQAGRDADLVDCSQGDFEAFKDEYEAYDPNCIQRLGGYGSYGGYGQQRMGAYGFQQQRFGNTQFGGKMFYPRSMQPAAAADPVDVAAPAPTFQFQQPYYGSFAQQQQQHYGGFPQQH